MIEQYRAWSGSTADLDGWTPIGRFECGELVAVAMTRGTEIHIAVAPEWRRRFFTRDRVRDCLAPLLEQHGFLTTRSVDGAQARFLRRIGFTHMWTEELIQHWMLSELPFHSPAGPRAFSVGDISRLS